MTYKNVTGKSFTKRTTEKMLFACFTVIGLLGVGLIVHAQGRGPHGGFGPGGPGGPGGWGSAKCAPSCPQYQFTYTRTSTQPVLLSTGPSTVTHTSTGTIAGDQYGSTYRDETVTPVGPWASSSGPQEIIFVRDFDPGVLMNYIEHIVTGANAKTTYEAYPIKTPPANAPHHNGPPPNGGGEGRFTPPTPTPLSYTLPDNSYTCAQAEKTTISHGANSSSTRIYCPALHVVLEEDRTDPRFGSEHYVLSGYTALTKFPFTPSGTLVKGHPFDHHHGPGGPGRGGPPPAP